MRFWLIRIYRWFQGKATRLSQSLKRRGLGLAELFFATGVTGAVTIMLFMLFAILIPSTNTRLSWIMLPLTVGIGGVISWSYAAKLTRDNLAMHTITADVTATHIRRHYENVRNRVLLIWTLIAGGWVFLSMIHQYTPTDHDLGGWFGATVTGMALLTIVGGLLEIAAAHQNMLLANFQDIGATIDPKLYQPGSVYKPIAGTIAALIGLAVILPSGVSPFQISDVDRWMYSLTERIGPALVPKDGPFRGLGQAITGRFTNQFGSGGAGTLGRIEPGLWLSTVLPIAVLAVLALIIVRIFIRRQRRMELSKSAGYVEWGFGWLWREFKSVVVRFFRRIRGWIWSTHRHDGQQRKDHRLPADPAGDGHHLDELSIEAIYAGTLQVMGEKGIPRKRDETPYEYFVRWLKGKPTDTEAFSLLTDIYVEKRYSGKDPTPSSFEKAHQAAKRLIHKF